MSKRNRNTVQLTMIKDFPESNPTYVAGMSYRFSEDDAAPLLNEGVARADSSPDCIVELTMVKDYPESNPIYIAGGTYWVNEPFALSLLNDGYATLNDPNGLAGGSAVVRKTYAEMQGLIAANGLIPMTTYIITDRGDNGILLTALTSNRLSQDGVRYMLCPTTYRYKNDADELGYIDAYGNKWIGVWNDTKQSTAAENDLTIWNGLVYKAGDTLSGDAPSEADSGWVVIPKNDFSNHEYTQMVFSVTYDIDVDWINQQRDGYGNVLGLDKAFYIWWYEPEEVVNLIDFCDWNMNKSGFIFANNKCHYIYNNSTSGNIYSNSTSGSIYINSNNGEISNNSNIGSIYSNSNSGGISDNSNNGDISNNSNIGSIYSNSNSAGISDNSGASAYSIYSNINNGSISGVWTSDVTDTVVDKVGE